MKGWQFLSLVGQSPRQLTFDILLFGSPGIFENSPTGPSFYIFLFILVISAEAELQRSNDSVSPQIQVTWPCILLSNVPLRYLCQNSFPFQKIRSHSWAKSKQKVCFGRKKIHFHLCDHPEWISNDLLFCQHAYKSCFHSANYCTIIEYVHCGCNL